MADAEFCSASSAGRMDENDSTCEIVIAARPPSIAEPDSGEWMPLIGPVAGDAS
jgi:hypothetical protein